MRVWNTRWEPQRALSVQVDLPPVQKLNAEPSAWEVYQMPRKLSVWLNKNPLAMITASTLKGHGVWFLSKIKTKKNMDFPGSPGLGVGPGIWSLPPMRTLVGSESSHLCWGTTCYVQRLRMFLFICFGHRIGKKKKKLHFSSEIMYLWMYVEGKNLIRAVQRRGFRTKAAWGRVAGPLQAQADAEHSSITRGGLDWCICQHRAFFWRS